MGLVRELEIDLATGLQVTGLTMGATGLTIKHSPICLLNYQSNPLHHAHSI